MTPLLPPIEIGPLDDVCATCRAEPARLVAHHLDNDETWPVCWSCRFQADRLWLTEEHLPKPDRHGDCWRCGRKCDRNADGRYSDDPHDPLLAHSIQTLRLEKLQRRLEPIGVQARVIDGRLHLDGPRGAITNSILVEAHTYERRER